MANTTNSTVNKSVGHSYVQYSGSIDFTGNLEDTHTTQAFLIAEANNTDAGFYSKASGGAGSLGDIQVTLQVSNNGSDWISVSTLLADHDAAAEIDQLLGDTNYEAFHAYKWARLSADGQASNDYTTIDWSVNLTKNEGITSLDNGTVIGGDVQDT